MIPCPWFVRRVKATWHRPIPGVSSRVVTWQGSRRISLSSRSTCSPLDQANHRARRAGDKHGIPYVSNVVGKYPNNLGPIRGQPHGVFAHPMHIQDMLMVSPIRIWYSKPPEEDRSLAECGADTDKRFERGEAA